MIRRAVVADQGGCAITHPRRGETDAPNEALLIIQTHC